MPLQATSGAASYDAFGGGVPYIPQYIEEVFSTWLYTGTNANQTIANGIDLSTKGGMVWTKLREVFAADHTLFDTNRGTGKYIRTNTTNAETTDANSLNSFNVNGFQLGSANPVNLSGYAFSSWTFRKQPKFFDVVTYTGTDSFGNSPQTIAHNLGSVPGCIFVRALNGGGVAVYHRGMTDAKDSAMTLNTSGGKAIVNSWGSLAPSSTHFRVNGSGTNATGTAYVAYVFAHDAGGFGLSGTDNVISCGSYVGNGSATGPVVSLAYEPQWLMIKNSTGTGNWQMIDNMRGMPVGSADATLQANLNSAESSNEYVSPTATGFQITGGVSEVNTNASNYIYIAIRRGPMKVPTTGTSVFSPNLSAASTGTAVTTGFPVDLQIAGVRPNYMLSVSNAFMDRLRGVSTNSTAVGNFLAATSTNAEVTNANEFKTLGWGNTGYNQDAWSAGTGAAIYWNFRRAPGFFDEVCYPGTGVAFAVTHNLQAVPQLIIVRERLFGNSWMVQPLSNPTKKIVLNSTAAQFDVGPQDWNDTAPTSSVFWVGSGPPGINQSGGSYVAYLFASCPGVSRVGSYTGNGSSQTINCGFTGGARFVMVKRTDATGNWLVVDTARGLVSAGDPTLYLNSTAAEVTGADWIDPDSSGFIVNQEGTMNANVNAATYIFLAIA